MMNNEYLYKVKWIDNLNIIWKNNKFFVQQTSKLNAASHLLNINTGFGHYELCSTHKKSTRRTPLSLENLLTGYTLPGYT